MFLCFMILEIKPVDTVEYVLSRNFCAGKVFYDFMFLEIRLEDKAYFVLRMGMSILFSKRSI